MTNKLYTHTCSNSEKSLNSTNMLIYDVLRGKMEFQMVSVFNHLARKVYQRL